jgi:peptidyl-prolyl cis-trans isomerase C
MEKVSMKRGCIRPRTIRLILGLSVMLGLAACGQPESSTEESAEILLPDNAVAQVDQTIIYNAAVQREALAQAVIAEGEILAVDDPEYGRLVDELVDQRLLAIEARRRNLQNTPEARRRIAAAEERILGNILLETEIATEVTEDAAQRLYSEQTELSRPGEQIRARHILVETREEADAIMGLLADGHDFSELAVQYSTDIATRLQGGDLGYFTREDVLPEIAALAFSALEGETSGPVQTESGWHILRIVDRRSPEGPTFEEMHPSIIRFLTFETISNLLDELHETARIEIIETPDAPESAVELEPVFDNDQAEATPEIQN